MQQASTDNLHEVPNLSEINPNHKYSGFGVVLDTTRGIRAKNQSEYSTQIKLIDMSMNPGSHASTSYIKQFITFFIYWTDEDSQPFPFKIGDIMRFHLFDFEKFKDFLQGKNRKGSSWAIFHGDSANPEPYCQSGEVKERITQFHIQRVNELRQWTARFFQQYSLTDLDWYSYERHIENPGVVQSFDMLLRVEDIRNPANHPNDLLVVAVDNKQNRFTTHVSSTHARFLREGDLVKMRSIERIQDDYLKGHNRYFAVLGIPTYFKDYKEFNDAITGQQNQQFARLEPMEEEKEQPQGHPGVFDAELFEKGGIILENGSILSSGISLRRKNLPRQTGTEILKDTEVQSLQRLLQENVKYNLRATLIDIRPKSLQQSLRNECKQCRNLRKLDAPEGETCCQRRMEKTIILRLLWQDQSLRAAKKTLITYIAPGGDDFVRSVFPDFPLKGIQSGNFENEQKLFEEIVERYLEDDRVFDVLLEPFDNPSLKEKDKQAPLRLTETLFIPVIKKKNDDAIEEEEIPEDLGIGDYNLE